MNSSSNSRTGNSVGSVSLNNFQFDFGIPSSTRSSARSLNDQKKQPAPPPSSYSSPAPPSSSSSSSWGPNKPSWTHQPAPSQAPSNPTSMVGDIFGKSWTSAAPSSSSSSSSHIGLPQSKNPDLFGDLLGAALGQQPPRRGGNVPLKDAGAAKSGSFSMGNLADSLPNSAKSTGSVPASPAKVGTFSSPGGVPITKMGGAGSMGGVPLRAGSSSASMASSIGADSFASLPNFGSFSNASKPAESKPAFASNFAPPPSMSNFPNYSPSPSPPTNSYSSSSAGDSFSKLDDFGVFSSPSQPAQIPQPKTVDPDPLDMLFSSSASASAGASGNQNSSSGAVDDWGSFDSGFDGGDAGGSTTELEGLPPPPTGVTAAMAKDKGMDNYKQGQFADAIKWLSWAVVLVEKSGDNATSMEVLSCRASCYKEVGEYKKAIADCTKVLETAGTNVAVLLQRALLYESSEKYKLGAEDLRAVLKIDPNNRLAKGTIHRLAKLANC